ncbi:hypothetical protein SBOR_8324 [Sclerotinia borealis F-4128]|uniref:AB hydrolase-1 domain-containing protein n=1 Tax=Sclerotinia borealis (strain F-4128) TaxID=1432307 RepID=W9C9S5_SCLBF|nr:hypothetical protein SBOR_8324 [Sclerotinia borealis F-4128]
MNPTVVIAPGAWPLVEFFQPLMQAFESRHYPAICKIPSSYTKETETAQPMNPDCKYLREEVLTPLVDEGKDVVLLMHSYGGVYGGSAVEGLSKTERTASGKAGGIIALVFCAAFTAPKGMTAMQVMGIDPENLPDWIHHDKETGLVNLTKAREMLFHDLPDDEANRLANALPKQPYASFAAPMLYDPYNDPSYKGKLGYIFTEADRIVPIVAQEMYAKQAGATETAVLKDSSHSPHLERPGELADATIEVVEKITGI